MKAIIFDLDGTIVFSHPTHFAAYQKLFGEFDITWTYEEFNDVFAGTGAPKIISDILTRSGITQFDLPVLVAKKCEAFNELLKGKKLKVVPGFFEFLEKIKKRGMKKIIASGSNRSNIQAVLSNIGIADEFANFISSVEDVPKPKPAPDIYLAAAALLKTAPTECLVIEDTTHGVIGAKKAGMKCVALTTTQPADILKNAGADLVIKNYIELQFRMAQDVL